ncbi:MAG: hypothetical protein IIT99_06335, partial [Bacteroidales bacterium]|nr:hypothetical protein [Bacteroidales bacterium]
SLLFHPSSFMLYFGQEFGERGMEAEGYSGVDGRTSIYDYCTVPSVRRWLAGRLTVEESVVYKEYCRLLRIATGDAIFSKGKTFDLMYVNPASDRFDPGRQFAWIRGYAGSAMSVVANFADHPVDVQLRIPKAAFDYLGIAAAGDRVIRVHVAAHDYTRTDVSSPVQD